MEKEKERTIKEIICSVSEGDRLQLALSDFNVTTFRARVAEINHEAGYRMFSIASCAGADMLFITHHPRQ